MSLYDKASLVLIPSGTKAGTVYSQKPVPSNDVLGDELVTNGTFDTDSSWIKETGWDIDGGVAIRTNTGSYTALQQNILSTGKKYKISIEIKSVSSGSIFGLRLGTNYILQSVLSSTGVFTATGIANGSTLSIMGDPTFSGSIDNVSVKEVIDGDFDFTRSSYATRVNSQGLIEKERSNLLLQSNSFDTNWGVYEVSTPTSGQTGYDGTSDAWLITKTATGFANIKQVITSINGVHTYSVYIKAGTNTSVIMRSLGSSDHIFRVNLSNGTSILEENLINSNIEDVGSGWYRCSMTFNANAVGNIYIYPEHPFDGTSVGNIYIQDAQVEQGLVATDVIETTTSAVYTGITDNVPRLDYDGDCPSLLLEPQRTNNITNTVEFTGVSLASSSFEYNQSISPDGTNNAIKVTRGTNDVVMRFRNVVETSKTYTFSIYVKTISGTQNVSMDITDDGVTSFTATTTWQRISTTVTVTRTPQSTYHFADFVMVGSTQGDSILVYGPQIEEGSYATSYIPTYSTSVTRSEDFCDNAGDSTIFNSQEGVLYAEIAALNDDLTFRVIGLSDDTNNNIIKFGYRANSNAIYFEVRDGNVSQAFQIAYVSDITQFHKVAIKFKENDFAMWIDGSEVKTDNLGTIPSGMTMINFDGGVGFANFLGKCKALAYFNRALTDTELADLTT